MSYTYLIGWSKLDRWYYGVRWKKGCNPSELWVTYRTSSKVVKQFAKENGEPDVIEVRKIFDSTDAARSWEHRVLKRMKVRKNDRWLNQTDNEFPFSNDRSYQKTPEFGLAISRGKTGSKFSEEGRDALRPVRQAYWDSLDSDARKKQTEAMREAAAENRRGAKWINDGKKNKLLKKGHKCPDGWSIGYLNGLTGRKQSPETIQKRRETRKRNQALRASVTT